MKRSLRILILLATAMALLAGLPAAATAAPALRGSSSTTIDPGTSISVPRPSAAQQGDVLVAALAVRLNGSQQITAPSGWSLVRRDAATGGAVLSQPVYLHVVGASEPTSYTWTFPVSTAASAAIVAYSGVDTAAPVVASSGRFTSYTAVITAPSVSTTAPDALVVGLFGSNGVRTITPPTGMVERVEGIANGDWGVSLEIADRTQASPGSTGDASAIDGTTNSSNIGQLVALRAAAGGSTTTTGGSTTTTGGSTTTTGGSTTTTGGSTTTTGGSTTTTGGSTTTTGGSTYYVSGSGSDSNPGTLDRPWKTIQKALNTASAGATILVRAGTYAEWLTAGRSGTAAAPIVLKAYPGEQVVMTGRLKITGSYVTVSRMIFVGQTTTNTSEVLIYVAGGDYVELSDNEVKNAVKSGIFLSGADGTRILRNSIHDNGTHYNLDHGIYYCSGTGALIADNTIDRNYAFGIQLYPNADNITVRNNGISGNGRGGVVIDNDGTATTDNNLIVANRVTNNVEYGVRTGSGRTPGTGNVVRDNVITGNPKGNVWDPFQALTLTNNTLV